MTDAELLTGVSVMLNDLEAIATYLRRLAKGEPTAVDAETVAEWADDLLADLGTVEAELGGRVEGESCVPAA